MPDAKDICSFDYNAPAELFPTRSRKGNRPMGYRRFAKAAEAIRFAIEELLGPGIYIAPTYGNTLMGLAASDMPTAADGYKINYYAPQPRAVAQVVDFDDYNKLVPYGAAHGSASSSSARRPLPTTSPGCTRRRES